MKALHQSPGSHTGIKKLLSLFCARFWMPAARSTAKSVVQQSASCQRAKDYGPPKPPMGHTGAVRPWQTLAVDVVGPICPDVMAWSICLRLMIVLPDM